MSGDDGFLARWSRRKAEARVGVPEGEPGSPAPPDAPVVGAEAGPPTALAVDAEPELSAEEIAALPRPDELTAATDLTPFLRRGVPELLRKAALRRMWALDPAVRDFVGEARDYSWDWNVADGVPGHGPLLPSDDVEATVARLFESRLDPPHGLGAGGPEPAAAEVSSAAIEASDEVGESAAGTEVVAAAPSAPSPTAKTPQPSARNRSHGGAVPL